MTDPLTVLLSGGAGAAAGGILSAIFLERLKNAIRVEFEQKLETHKAQLRHEAEKEIELLKAQLQITAIRYSQVFEKRVEGAEISLPTAFPDWATRVNTSLGRNSGKLVRASPARGLQPRTKN